MKAIGQSLNYAKHTGKHAGIVLIIRKGREKHWENLNDFIRHYDLPIDIRMFHGKLTGFTDKLLIFLN